MRRHALGQVILDARGLASWLAPRGSVDEGEEPLAALRRCSTLPGAPVCSAAAVSGIGVDARPRRCAKTCTPIVTAVSGATDAKHPNLAGKALGSHAVSKKMSKPACQDADITTPITLASKRQPSVASFFCKKPMENDRGESCKKARN